MLVKRYTEADVDAVVRRQRHEHRDDETPEGECPVTQIDTSKSGHWLPSTRSLSKAWWGGWLTGLLIGSGWTLVACMLIMRVWP